ncbi:hypothetical protein BGX24_008920 [Mortierella sp. AD032]|nr:hypothetical protein BGX24_008920 [Mortierella sp. AD032]
MNSPRKGILMKRRKVQATQSPTPPQKQLCIPIKRPLNKLEGLKTLQKMTGNLMRNLEKVATVVGVEGKESSAKRAENVELLELDKSCEFVLVGDEVVRWGRVEDLGKSEVFDSSNDTGSLEALLSCVGPGAGVIVATVTVAILLSARRYYTALRVEVEPESATDVPQE